jgi:hypothetical protein
LTGERDLAKARAVNHPDTANTAKAAHAGAAGGPKPRAAAAPLRALALVLPLAFASFAACAGPAITTPIEGEPLCPDFQVGAAHTKMNGGLRFPVHLIIKNGSNVVFKTTLLGRRSDKDVAARVILADDNESYTVTWAQCENERAPKPVEGTGRDAKGTTARYECGTDALYKTEPLVTKKGDPKSHALAFAPPPNAACWESPPPAVESPDAGAPDAAADAEPASPDAGADAILDAGSDAAADGGDAGAASDAGAKVDPGKSGKGAAKPN